MTKFTKPKVLQPLLKQRVAKLVEPRLKMARLLIWAKAFFFLALAVVGYCSLIFFSTDWISSVALALVLAIGAIGIAFSIQHDANHGAMFESQTLNLLAGHSLDLIGASSYFWKNKHNTNHHTFTNIAAEDPDIEIQPLARMSPDHKWYWFHAFQHWYLWFAYSFVHLRYLFSDPQRMFFGKKDDNSLRYPQGLELVLMIAVKLVFLILAFAIPMMFHPWYWVLAFYTGISMAIGVIFSVTFQLAHAVDIVDHPSQQNDFSESEWMVQQIRTTANFSTNNKLVTFFLGGLNFQREHHLFPKVPHTLYPLIEKEVEQFCAEHNLAVCEHKSLMAAIRSHYRFLRDMGRKPKTPALAEV